ncbi:hypothetical protein [uncultured Nostoc sp.]|uniref:hypothetical protein n=1 Tax=uncultured Nostoc sp. TaxID=340711 RepID=UPI0026398BEE|nr:hypothetical protein [uncultured Nostoc sp.]
MHSQLPRSQSPAGISVTNNTNNIHITTLAIDTTSQLAPRDGVIAITISDRVITWSARNSIVLVSNSDV